MEMRGRLKVSRHIKMDTIYKDTIIKDIKSCHTNRGIYISHESNPTLIIISKKRLTLIFWISQL